MKVKSLSCVRLLATPWTAAYQAPPSMGFSRQEYAPLKSIKKKRHHFGNKGPYIQSYGFSSSHVWMLELDHKESWAPNNWWLWTVVLEKTLESPLDCKKNKPVKEISPEYSLGGLRLKLKLQYFGHLMWRIDSLKRFWCWDGLKAGGEGNNWGWDGWMHHRLNGYEFEQAPGVGDGQGGLACCMGSQRVRHDWATELKLS